MVGEKRYVIVIGSPWGTHPKREGTEVGGCH